MILFVDKLKRELKLVQTYIENLENYYFLFINIFIILFSSILKHSSLCHSSIFIVLSGRNKTSESFPTKYRMTILLYCIVLNWYKVSIDDTKWYNITVASILCIEWMCLSTLKCIKNRYIYELEILDFNYSSDVESEWNLDYISLYLIFLDLIVLEPTFMSMVLIIIINEPITSKKGTLKFFITLFVFIIDIVHNYVSMKQEKKIVYIIIYLTSILLDNKKLVFHNFIPKAWIR